MQKLGVLSSQVLHTERQTNHLWATLLILTLHVGVKWRTYRLHPHTYHTLQNSARGLYMTRAPVRVSLSPSNLERSIMNRVLSMWVTTEYTASWAVCALVSVLPLPLPVMENLLESKSPKCFAFSLPLLDLIDLWSILCLLSLQCANWLWSHDYNFNFAKLKKKFQFAARVKRWVPTRELAISDHEHPQLDVKWGGAHKASLRGYAEPLEQRRQCESGECWFLLQIWTQGGSWQVWKQPWCFVTASP